MADEGILSAIHSGDEVETNPVLPRLAEREDWADAVQLIPDDPDATTKDGQAVYFPGRHLSEGGFSTHAE